MTSPINFDHLVPADSIAGESAQETLLLRELLMRAESYIRTFPWCPQIAERYFAFGVGAVVGVFLFRFEQPAGGSEDFLWVVVGDLPSAYFVVDDAYDSASARGLLPPCGGVG